MSTLSSSTRLHVVMHPHARSRIWSRSCSSRKKKLVRTLCFHRTPTEPFQAEEVVLRSRKAGAVVHGSNRRQLPSLLFFHLQTVSIFADSYLTKPSTSLFLNLSFVSSLPVDPYSRPSCRLPSSFHLVQGQRLHKQTLLDRLWIVVAHEISPSTPFPIP